MAIAAILALGHAGPPHPAPADLAEFQPLAPWWQDSPILPAADADHMHRCTANDASGYKNITRVYSTTANGTYGIGSAIDISVEAPLNFYSQSLAILQHSWIDLETGDVDRTAVHQETRDRQFMASYVDYRYTVQEGDFSDGLDWKDDSSLHWGWGNSRLVQDATQAYYNCKLPNPGQPGSLSYQSDIVVDGIRPLLHNVTAGVANGTYGAGSNLNFTASFSKTVFVVQGGEPVLTLDFDGTYRNATYASGNETRSLVFEYTVQPGDDAARLDYNATNALLGSVRDLAKNDVNRAAVAAPGEPGSLGRTSEIATETDDPEVASVSLLGPGRTYKLGETIRINVTFTEPVTVDIAGGRPTLPLNTTGGAAGAAVYHSGSGSASLEFRYTVGTGHESASLDHGSPLSLNGGTIKDVPGNNANLDLSGLTGADRLAASPNLSVDGKIPRVTGVSSPNSTAGAPPHGIDDVVHVRVAFDEDVTVAGAPTLRLETGAADRDASYHSGSGTQTLVFRYTVGQGDESDRLNYTSGTPFALGAGASIRDDAGNDANLDMSGLGSTATLAGSSGVAVDGKRPEVTIVQSPNGTGPHGAGKTLHVRVAFDEDVTVTGMPTLRLETGAADRDASYHSGSGTQTLVFRYTVGQDDESDSLNYTSSTPFALGAGASIRDDAGNDANLDLSGLPSGSTLAGSSGVAVDGKRPAVESVTSPNGTGPHGIDDVVHVRVAFDEDVTVAGAPTIALATGGAGSNASYHSGSGTQTLVFRYQVGQGDLTGSLNYTSGTPFALGAGASIRDDAGNDANLDLSGLPSGSTLAGSSGVAVDGKRPAVESVASPNGTGTYYPNQLVHVHVRFDETVTVTGAPHVRLNSTGAGDDARAVYKSGSGGEELAFVYNVLLGNEAETLGYAGVGALQLGGGSIKDAAGNPAVTSLPASDSPGYRLAAGGIGIDGDVVSALSVSSPDDDGAYGAGARINVTVTFSEAVRVDGTAPRPHIALNAGEGARAEYESGSGSEELAFVYSARPGDAADLLATKGGLVGADSINAVEGGEAARPELPAPGWPGSLDVLSAVSIDTAAPAVERVWSPNATGTYAAGDAILVVVEFSENVTVAARAGAPALLLETGETDRAAAYASGSGTPALAFAYTVAAGDDSGGPLDYAGASALSLNGGAIMDAAGNPANLALPEPGSPGSLSRSSAITLLGLAGPVTASADASFTGPNTVRIEYDRPLGAPADHEGPVYGAITLAGGGGERSPLPGGESGLGTSVHTVRFGGAGVGSGQAGSIALNTDLVFAAGSAQYNFTADSIDIAAGDTARTLSPRGVSPVVAIEPDGFVRAVNATAAGEGARPAVNVTGLATLPDSGGRVAIIASFAEVSFPPGAAVQSVPGGLLVLRVSERAPPAPEAVAAAFGASNASGIAVWRLVVEAGGGENGTRIAFDKPVRILLAGQANGSAFYLEGPRDDPRVVPIVDACAADDADAVHSHYVQLGRTGVCQIDSGPDKVVYAYHLAPFGAARGPGGGPVLADCGISLERPEIKFGEVPAGSQSAARPQAVTNAGSMPLSEVSMSARPWMDAAGSVQVMPAGATSVLPAGGGGEWTPMNGEVDLPLDGGRADLQLRLDVPPGAPPAVGASQIVTYTASCAAAAP